MGAAGGLGGFVPPLILAAVLAATGSYAGAFVLLALAALLALGVTARMDRTGRRVAEVPAPA